MRRFFFFLLVEVLAVTFFAGVSFADADPNERPPCFEILRDPYVQPPHLVDLDDTMLVCPPSPAEHMKEVFSRHHCREGSHLTNRALKLRAECVNGRWRFD